MENEDIKNDPLINLVGMIFQRKFLIIIGFLSVFSVAIISSVLMPPVYQTTTKIYISRPSLPRLNAPEINEFRNKSFLGNQKEIIKSRFLREKVVRKLNLHNKKHVSSFSKRLKNRVYSLLEIERPIPNPLEEAIANFEDRISIRLARRTNILMITATSGTPENAALYANTLAQTYINYTNDLLYSKSRSAYAYIEEDMEKARKKLMQDEKAMNEYKEREMAMSMQNEYSVISRKLFQLEEKYQEVQAEIQNIRNQISYIGKGKSGGLDSAQQYSSPEIKEIRALIKNLRSELAGALVSYTEDHPDIKSLQHQIVKLEEKLSQAGSNVKNVFVDKNKAQAYFHLDSLKHRKDSLAKQIQTINDRRLVLTKKKFELDKLTRAFVNSEKRYVMLTTKLEEARMLKATEIKDVSIKVIDPALPPPYPIRKKQKIIIIIGGLVGIIFGLGMAFIVEYLYDAFKTPEEVEEYLNLSVLGVIPSINRKIRKVEQQI